LGAEKNGLRRLPAGIPHQTMALIKHVICMNFAALRHAYNKHAIANVKIFRL